MTKTNPKIKIRRLTLEEQQARGNYDFVWQAASRGLPSIIPGRTTRSHFLSHADALRWAINKLAGVYDDDED